MTTPDSPSTVTVELDLSNPSEKVVFECLEVLRERRAKYTDGNWDDNFVFVAEAMQREGFPDFKPADHATVMMLTKNARQAAARASGRHDFADDSLRDSAIDDINYRILRLALRDTHG